MKKGSLLIAGFLIILITAAFSHHLIQVSPFPVLFHFNGEEKELNEEYKVFNYKDHAYVPIRFISEQMGAQIAYTNDPNRISISYLEERPLTSSITASETNGPLTLSLYSEQEVYQEGDVIRVWAVLENDTQEQVTIYGPDPFIHFSLAEASGKGSGERVQTVANPMALNPGGIHQRQMPLSVIYMYHFIDEHDLVDFHEDGEIFRKFISQNPNSNQLPKGTYTIKAIADYSFETIRNSKDLSAEIMIRVE